MESVLGDIARAIAAGYKEVWITGVHLGSYGRDLASPCSLAELLQGRSFEGLNDLPRPTFESNAVTEPNNFVEHFIDSSGIMFSR